MQGNLAALQVEQGGIGSMRDTGIAIHLCDKMLLCRKVNKFIAERWHCLQAAIVDPMHLFKID